MSTLRSRPPGLGQLTPRQREVLELIARGRTNWQIAEALGISLEGAKWHVREIMGELGVETREEAAEYWRRERGLPTRLLRAIGGLVPAAAALRVGAAIGAVAVLAAAALFVVLALQGDEEPPPAVPATPTEEPGATETPEPSPDPTVASTPTATLDVNGRRVPLATAAVTLSADEPRNIAMLVVTGCEGCPPESMERLLWKDSTTPTAETLLSATDYGGTYLTGLGAGTSGSVIVVGVCASPPCEFGPGFSVDARVRIMRSIDGGVTWADVATVDGFAAPLGVTPDGQAIVQRRDESGLYVVKLPSGDRYELPDGLGRPEFPWVVGGQPMWKPTAAGSTLWTLHGKWSPDVPADSALTGVIYWGRNGVIYQWSGLDGQDYVGDPDEGGVLGIAWRIPMDELRVQAWAYGSTSFAGTAHVDGERVLVLVHQGPDPKELRLEPLKAPPGTPTIQRVVAASSAGRFARVATAGCLDVRESPSPHAPTVGCYAGGVLLFDLGETVDVGGQTWRKVYTPAIVGDWAGRTGWANDEFLE
jgi:DNA-binding CsgD family transcriptional regulator